MTSGITISPEPDDTSMVTCWPLASISLAPGVWLTTTPSSTSSLSTGTGLGRNPASVRVRLASSSVAPTTLGTGTASGLC